MTSSDRFAQSLVKLLLSSTGVIIALICQGCGETDRNSGDPAEPGETVFTIEGKTIRLEDGTVSLTASTTGDLNNDGHDDLAAVLVLDSKGSGVFYYLNVLLSTGEGDWRSAGEEFLGDRIKFDFIDIYGAGSVSRLTGVPIHPDNHSQIVVGYHVHDREQAYAEKPKLFITRHWRVDDKKLVSVEDY